MGSSFGLMTSAKALVDCYCSKMDRAALAVRIQCHGRLAYSFSLAHKPKYGDPHHNSNENVLRAAHLISLA